MDTKFEFDDEKNATLQRVKKLGKVLATDVALIGIRKPKHAHRCVLQMFSDYFVRQFQFFEPKSVYVVPAEVLGMEKVIDLMYNGSVTIPNEGVEEFQAALSIFQIKGYTIKSVDAAATSENRKKSSQSKPNGAEPENLSLAVKQPSAGVPKKPKKAAASKQVAKQSVNGQPMAHSKRPNVQTSITVNANGVKFIKPNVHATKPQAKSRQAVKEDDNKSAGLKNGHDTEVPINQSNGDSSQDKCPTISANANGVKMIKPNVQPTTPQPEPLPAVNPDDDKNTDLENGHDTEVQINHPNGDSNQNGSESLVNGNGQHTETTPAEEVLNGEVDQPEVMNGEIATNGTSENFNGESKDDEMETVITECM